jgi:STE24 endopeptidase
MEEKDCLMKAVLFHYGIMIENEEVLSMIYLVIGVILGVYLFELLVAVLNNKYRLNPIPENIKDVYDEEKYKNWLNYSLDQHRFSMIKRGFNLVVLLVLLLSGAFGWLEGLVSGWSDSIRLQTLYFLGVYLVFTTLIAIPFRYHAQFVIEERYGFNKSTTKTFAKDVIKGLVLILFLGGWTVFGLQTIYLNTTNLWSFILFAWLGIALIMILVFMFINRLIMRAFNKFTPLPEGELRDKIFALASKVGFNLKALYVMDASKRTSKLNAFFSGIGKTKEVVLYDTLIEKMSDDEILAVLAHELGHAVHKDTTRMLIQQILLLGLYAGLIGIVLQSAQLMTPFGLSGIHFGFGLILFTILMAPFDLILGIPRSYLSRKAEYKADAFAVSQTDKVHMASALKVLYRVGLSNLNPHPLAVLLYYSHPPMSERLKAILNQ